MRRPAQLVYGAEDVPPSAVMLLSGLQHVVVVTMFFVYPLIVMREAGIAALQVADILRVGMLVLALGTLVQALPIGPVGSRLLAPVNFTALYFPASLLAAWACAALAVLTLCTRRLFSARSWLHERP